MEKTLVNEYLFRFVFTQSWNSSDKENHNYAREIRRLPHRISVLYLTGITHAEIEMSISGKNRLPKSL